MSYYIFVMRVMLHPSLDGITLESLFYALGNKERIQIIANLYRAGDTALICAETMKGIDDLPQSTTSHHFRILREGGLVHSERKGKECYNTLRLKELETKFPGLMKTILKAMAMHNY